MDFVIVGEGEKSFLELIKTLESGRKNFMAIDGCAYKNRSQIVLNPKNHFIQNLDSLPYPVRNPDAMEFYFNHKTNLYGLGKHRAASIITSRSCPYNCQFCSMHLSHGPKWRFRSPENVYGEIEELVKKYQVEELFIMDDNFTLDPQRAMEICRLIIKNNLKIKWNTPNGIRLDTLNSDLIKIMKKSGCVNICVGIESGNEMIRNKIVGKNLATQTIYDKVKLCQKENLQVIGFFILGLPEETSETFQDTLKMVKKLPLSMIATSFYTPLPGTKLYDYCLKKKYLKKDYWYNLPRFNIPYLETPSFNQKTLRLWKKQLFREFIKTHWQPLLTSIITLKNPLLKIGILKRVLWEKFSYNS